MAEEVKIYRVNKLLQIQQIHFIIDDPILKPIVVKAANWDDFVTDFKDLGIVHVRSVDNSQNIGHFVKFTKHSFQDLYYEGHHDVLATSLDDPSRRVKNLIHLVTLIKRIGGSYSVQFYHNFNCKNFADFTAYQDAVKFYNDYAEEKFSFFPTDPIHKAGVQAIKEKYPWIQNTAQENSIKKK